MNNASSLPFAFIQNKESLCCEESAGDQTSLPDYLPTDEKAKCLLDVRGKSFGKQERNSENRRMEKRDTKRLRLLKKTTIPLFIVQSPKGLSTSRHPIRQMK